MWNPVTFLVVVNGTEQWLSPPNFHFRLAYHNSAESYVPSPESSDRAGLEGRPLPLGAAFVQGDPRIESPRLRASVRPGCAPPHNVRPSCAGAQAPRQPPCAALPNCTTVATRRQPETGNNGNTYTTKSSERYKPRVSAALFLEGEKFVKHWLAHHCVGPCFPYTFQLVFSSHFHESIGKACTESLHCLRRWAQKREHESWQFLLQLGLQTVNCSVLSHRI